MSLVEWTTVRPEHIHRLAEELADRKLPCITQLEPIADFEELYTFAETNPTPVVFSPQIRHGDWNPLRRALLRRLQSRHTNAA